jgi:hypothetical protein
MRFAIRGYTDPLAFPIIFHEIADRLLHLGVDEIYSINLYVTASIDGQELKPFDKSGAAAEMVRMWVPVDPAIAAQRPPLPKVYIVRPIDISRAKLCANFFGRLRFCPKDLSDFLQISKEDLGELAVDRLSCEFDANALERITVFSKMIETARQLFPNWGDVIDWFSGPHLHSKLAGMTPREQLKVGGAAAAAEIAKVLQLHLKRMRFGECHPTLRSGYYDAITNEN